MRLDGKVALITGAGGGMGEVEARLFAREGARVIVADVLEAEGHAIVHAIGAAGGEAMFVRLDVTSEDSWTEAVAAAVRRFGTLNVLVNNAGIVGPLDPAQGLGADAWDRLMDVNARGVFLGIKHAIPEMRKAGIGSIVNISSISGFIGQTGLHPGYNASKGAVRILTKSFAVKLAHENIRVNSVHPGISHRCGSSNRRWNNASRRWCRCVGWDAAKKWQTRCCSWPRMRRPISPAPNWWSTAGIWHCRDESLEMLGIRDELRYNGLHHACTTRTRRGTPMCVILQLVMCDKETLRRKNPQMAQRIATIKQRQTARP